jgi:predicted PurR-regulated permease PerM
MDQPRRSVDVRHVALTTVVVVAVALGSYGAVMAVGRLWRIVTYLLVALFFAVILTPAVDLLQQRANLRRGIATALVVITGLAVLSGLIYAFVKPLVDQGTKFSDSVPEMVDDAQEGKGPVGRLVKEYEIEKWVEENRETIDQQARAAGTKGLDLVRQVFSGIIAALTVLVLTILMILRGPELSEATIAILPEHRRERVRRVAADAASAVSGYMLGNLVISIIAGVAAYIFLRLAGVPYPEVLALWVAFADLIPLVGATLGAVPTIAVAFLHSVPAGIAAVVFFILYQQFENNVLQVTVMSRTVNLNPLGVLISVMIGVELFGLLGALLAIPAAGVIQVVVRDLWDEQHGRPKGEPTIGASETPLSEA